MYGASRRNNAARRRSPETPSIKNITPSCPPSSELARCDPPYPRGRGSSTLLSAVFPPRSTLVGTAATDPNNNVPLLDLHSLHRALKYASHEDRPRYLLVIHAPLNHHRARNPSPSGSVEQALSPRGNVVFDPVRAVEISWPAREPLERNFRGRVISRMLTPPCTSSRYAGDMVSL